MKKKIENGSVQNVANHTSPIQPSTHTLSLIAKNCIIRYGHLMIPKGTKPIRETNMDEQQQHEREDQIFEFLGKLGLNNWEGDSSDNCIRHYLKQPIDHIKSNNEDLFQGTQYSQIYEQVMKELQSLNAKVLEQEQIQDFIDPLQLSNELEEFP